MGGVKICVNVSNIIKEVVGSDIIICMKKLPVVMVLCMCTVVIVAGTYLFLVQQDAPQNMELIRNEVERENVTPQPQNSVSQGPAPATALGKAIASLQKAISDDTSKTVHEQNYSDS